MYVPQIHPIALGTFHEREDEGHVFNVIVSTCVYCEFKVHIYCVIQRIGGHTIMGAASSAKVL